MYPDDAHQNFTYEDLKQLVTNSSMFIVADTRRRNRHRLTALQYLMKINLLFMHSINNNN